MKEIFTHLQCSATQAKLYEILLENGPTIASMLAKRSGVKRVTAYGALDGMLSKGLVETYKKNHVSYYQAADPELIANRLEIQFEEEERFMKRARKELKEMKLKKDEKEREIIEVKDVISYYEGKDAVNTLIEENLSLSDKTQYCIGMSGYHALKDEGEWRNYIKRRVEKGMKVQSIQADTEVGKKYQKRDEKELRTTRLVPSSNLPDEGELNIIGNHIILYTSEGEEAIGVKITHKKIAKILKKLFKMAWERAKDLESPR